MKRIVSRNTWTWSLVTLSCLGMLMGQLPAWALSPQTGPAPDTTRQSTARPAAAISDIALDASGQLAGQVVDSQGQPVDGVLVVLRQGRRVVARTVSSKDGKFVVANVPAGLYQLDSGATRNHIRVWSSTSAPPQAHGQAVLVSEPGTVVRGHHIEEAIDQLDAVTLAMVATSIAAVAIAGATYDKIDDLEAQIDALETVSVPASPN
tara:strand:- start:10 stop:630 length:621 start_codon:yes stop_codon:yes gene_type:complete